MNIRAIAAILVIALPGGFAQAASIALQFDPPLTTIPAGASFTLKLVLDASDKSGSSADLFSGSVIVDFNKDLLRYDGFVLTSGLSYFQSPAVTTTGSVEKVRLGFDNAAPVGTVGTFSFTAVGNAGNFASIGLADPDAGSGGSFVNTVSTNQSFIPTPAGAGVSIVPLPAGVWLLGTGLGALVARRRLRHAVR